MPGPISDTSSLKGLVRRLPWLPWGFLRIYVYPSLVRGQKAPFDAGSFFEQHYAEVTKRRPIDDAGTISRVYDPLHAQLHYNAVEASILRALVARPPDGIHSLLDVGSGSGHWLDFMMRVVHPARCVASEISPLAFRFPSEK